MAKYVVDVPDGDIIVMDNWRLLSEAEEDLLEHYSNRTEPSTKMNLTPPGSYTAQKYSSSFEKNGVKVEVAVFKVNNQDTIVMQTTCDDKITMRTNISREAATHLFYNLSRALSNE